jgi:hypothetical protein
MEDNFKTLITWAYDFLVNTSFTAFGVTINLLTVLVGLFLFGLLWYALYKIFD